MAPIIAIKAMRRGYLLFFWGELPEVYTAQKGDSFFIPAQDSELRVCISGTAKFITVCICLGAR